MSISILGSVGGESSPFQPTDISALLDSCQADLAHGSALTGRPGTSLYLDEHQVLKVRNELRLDARSAERWARQALDKERAYQVHHPDKTWFLAPRPDDPGSLLIGNICPRLRPLHVLLREPDPPSEQVARFLDYLESLFDLYCRIASRQNARLDEGLSNFGLDQAGRLYYLDDDVYPWDRFVSSAHIFGVYFRSLPWLDTRAAFQLGLRLRTVIERYFEDDQYATVLAEQLRDVFLSNEAQRQAVARFSDSLRQARPAPVAAFKPRQSRYLALLADVHANLPALRAVLDFLDKEGIHGGLVLGDVVGYGPYPTECIELLQQENFLVLKGNHDHGLATGHFQSGFSVTASWVLEWSHERVSPAHKQWLHDLLPVLREEGWMALHGAPMDPTFFNAYVYEMTYENNLDYMQARNLPLCFHGHTHLPGLYARYPGRQDRHYLEPVMDLGRYSHVLLCPGSVGQPRNRKSGAQFAIYDQEQHVAHFHSVPYDLQPVLAEMRRHGFPDTLLRILENR